MSKRVRLIRLDKQPKMIWSTPGGLGLFIIMCVMMVVLIQMLRAPGFLGFMLPKEPPKAPMKGQASPTETMQAKEEKPRQPVPPKPHVALSPEEEKALFTSVVDQEPLEKKPYFYLLAKANSMSAAQIDAGIDPNTTYDSFAEAPAAARGKLVKLRGLLLKLKETEITDKMGSGFDSVWEGLIMDTELRPILFVLTQRPPNDWFAVGRDNVVLKGFFLKNLVYKNRGGEFTAAPMIIAKGLVKIVAPAAEQTFWSRYGEYVIIVLIVLVVVGASLGVHWWKVSSAATDRPRPYSSEPLEVVSETPSEDEPEEQPAGKEDKAEAPSDSSAPPPKDKPEEPPKPQQ